MLFQLLEIDREATKKKIETILDNYRVVLLQIPDDLLPKVTAGFNLVPLQIQTLFIHLPKKRPSKELKWKKNEMPFWQKYKRP